jgi:hypothetical protein
MARKSCAFRVTDVRRAIDAVKSAGEAIGRVRIETDGTIVIEPGAPSAEEKKGPPNSFDQVLGGAA